MGDCDVVLVEGDTSTTAAKIEVWRSENDTIPICEHDASIEAIVTDDPVSVRIPVLGRSDVPGLVQWIMSRLQIQNPAADRKSQL